VKGTNALAGWHDDHVTVSADSVFSRRFEDVTDDMRAHADTALKLYRVASAIPFGGIAMLTAQQSDIDIRCAWLRCVRNEFDEAETILRRAYARDPRESTASALATLLRNRNDPAKSQEALDLYERLLPEHPEYTFMLTDYEMYALPAGRIEQVMTIHRERLKRDPRNLPSLRSMSILLLQGGQWDEGMAITSRWIDRDPKSAEAHRMRALALADLRQLDQAIVEMRIAADLAPHDAFTLNLLADMLDMTGRSTEAAAIRQRISGN
jgi:tetratricopeptide (TPR) repeat protein